MSYAEFIALFGLFWEGQESRQSTRQGEQETLDKSYQYKFNGLKSCLLKERKGNGKENPLYALSYISYMSLRLGSSAQPHPTY